jgi:hypothetical protein
VRTETGIRDQTEALRYLTTAQLKEKCREVFGKETRSNHKQFLLRRTAWRVQANAWGGPPNAPDRPRSIVPVVLHRPASPPAPSSSPPHTTLCRRRTRPGRAPSARRRRAAHPWRRSMGERRAQPFGQVE